MEEAAQAYQQALLKGGPDATTCFNLANVLYALGRLEPAVERYLQVIEMEPGFVEAWNNLGIVLDELEQRCLCTLGAQYSYDQARQFAETIAKLVNQQLPNSTSLVRSPLLRQGRVYLDFL